MNSKLWLLALLFLGAVYVLLSIAGPTSPVSSPRINFLDESKKWIYTTPEEQGMDSTTLVSLIDEVIDKEYALNSMAIVRNGFVVLDAPIYPFHSASRHTLFSCTKSVIGTLIGIAIDKGFIQSVEQRIVDLFPENSIENLDERKKAMTLEHVLTMTTGLACRDSYLYGWKGLQQMQDSADWAQHVLNLPMQNTPGSRFEYCNGASHILSAIISRTTGMSSKEFAEQHLFTPLGITDVEWSSDPDGISVGYSDLYLRTLDMAKLGQTYLTKRTQEGGQLLSSEWIDASTKSYSRATLQDGYGYQWWIDDSGYFMALGFAGQFIFVLPEKDMVVVFTSSLEEQDFYVPQRLLHNYIIPAAISDAPLPENLNGTSALNERVKVLVAF